MAKINQREYEILKSLDDQWEWIARDSDDIYVEYLFAYSEKPFKRHDEECWDYGSGIFSIDNRLFRFIRWEDEEPYNIDELIEEYEVESEGTEVKKDKEDLIKYLKKEISNFKPGQMIYDYLTFILKQLNELDEPEVKKLERKIKELDSYNDELIRDNNQLRNAIDNQEVLSQKWIDEHQYISRDPDNPFVYVKDLQNLLVMKQELPVIPKFVADWIKEIKPYNSLRVSFEYIAQRKMDNRDDELALWLEEGNSEVFARAWLDGYTEEEQKYNVEIRSSFGTVGIFLFKQGDEILAGDNFKVYDPKEDEFRLTEQEIRSFQNGDVLFEHFAVKVEEDNNVN